MEEDLEKQAASMTPEQIKTHNNNIAKQLVELSGLYQSKGKYASFSLGSCLKYSSLGDHWRQQTFAKCAGLVRASPKAVMSAKQASGIKGLCSPVGFPFYSHSRMLRDWRQNGRKN
jgi:hypothetical protein